MAESSKIILPHMNSSSRPRGHRKIPTSDGSVNEAEMETEVESSQQPRRTCTACKASKVKCDRAAPVCGRCVRLKLTCVQQRRAQGRPVKFANHVLMPPRLDRLPKDRHSDERVWHEASAQWAADYMAYAFSNLLKQGAVHRIKTLAVLRVWMIFSLYYGVDLTRGFLGVALVLLDASVQDLFNIGDRVPEPLILQDSVKDEPTPDPSNAEPILSILQDEEAATMCCVGCRGGVGASLCNDMFRRTFFRDSGAADSAMHECALPIFKYAKIIAPEDRGEFMESLANLCFGTHAGPAHISHISRVVDKDGATFLAIVRLRSMCLGDGRYTADILTVEPVPVSKYVVPQTTDGQQGRGGSSSQSLSGKGRGRRTHSSFSQRTKRSSTSPKNHRRHSSRTASSSSSSSSPCSSPSSSPPPSPPPPPPPRSCAVDDSLSTAATSISMLPPQPASYPSPSPPPAPSTTFHPIPSQPSSFPVQTLMPLWGDSSHIISGPAPIPRPTSATTSTPFHYPSSSYYPQPRPSLKRPLPSDGMSPIPTPAYQPYQYYHQRGPSDQPEGAHHPYDFDRPQVLPHAASYDSYPSSHPHPHTHAHTHIHTHAHTHAHPLPLRRAADTAPWSHDAPPYPSTSYLPAHPQPSPHTPPRVLPPARHATAGGPLLAGLRRARPLRLLPHAPPGHLPAHPPHTGPVAPPRAPGHGPLHGPWPTRM